MKKRILVKSVLDSYTFIPAVTKGIDKRVLATSMKTTGTYWINDTLSVMNEVVDLIERKKKLINLKCLIDDCFKNISSENARLCVLRYVDKLSIKEISEIVEISERTTRRLLESALDEVYNYFSEQGFDSFNLLYYLKDEQWIVGKYKNEICKKLSLLKSGQKKKAIVNNCYIY